MIKLCGISFSGVRPWRKFRRESSECLHFYFGVTPIKVLFIFSWIHYLWKWKWKRSWILINIWWFYRQRLTILQATWNVCCMTGDLACWQWGQVKIHWNMKDRSFHFQMESSFMSQHTGQCTCVLNRFLLYPGTMRSVTCATTADVSDRTT